MRQQLPEAWAELATKAGVRASARGIAERTGLAVTTITRLIAGNQATPDTVAVVADALGVDQSVIYRLTGIDAGELGPWIPPRAANNLKADERLALEQLIRAVTRNRGSDDADEKMTGRPADTTDTGGESSKVARLSDRAPKVQKPERRVASRRSVKPEDEDPDSP